MIPMRTSSIFKSRWMALIWSAGIIWMAIDIAGSPDDSDNQSAAVADNGVSQAITAFDGIK
jgi:hypothetical protein